MEAQEYDREQVIKELEKQIRITESVNSGWVHLTIEKAKKALELLKERETKLLEADEIISGIIYWMECENVSQVWPIEMHYIRNQHLLNGPEWEDDYGDVWKMPEYNKKWRCWTEKPTDEQRKVVKWDFKTD